MRFRRLFCRGIAFLFPLNTSRGLGGYIIQHAVAAVDLADDAGGDAAEEIVGQLGHVGGHEVVGGDGADGNGVGVGALVAHDAHAAGVGQYGEILGDLAVPARLGDLLAEDQVAFPDDANLFGGQLADDADGQAGAGEGLTVWWLLMTALPLTWPLSMTSG